MSGQFWLGLFLPLIAGAILLGIYGLYVAFGWLATHKKWILRTKELKEDIDETNIEPLHDMEKAIINSRRWKMLRMFGRIIIIVRDSTDDTKEQKQ
jgi:hypothetical protein